MSTATLSLRPAVAADSFPVSLMTDNRHYTVANTHSHNDYEQPIPFWMAWQEQFGSIEADIWWVDGQLLVGHNRDEIRTGKTLEQYYVRPLLSCIRNNNGHPYADSSRPLQILIDVKTDSIATLNALVALLHHYPELEQNPFVKWVISGNRPSPALFSSYPPFIAFDGILHDHYTPEALSKIVMMSDDLHYYTHWNGLDPMPAAEKAAIKAAVSYAHALHLPVRFWDAPDFRQAWDQLMQLHTDYINTDHIRELSAYLHAL